MSTVYILQHVSVNDEYPDLCDIEILGVYASEEMANLEMSKLNKEDRDGLYHVVEDWEVKQWVM